MTCIHADGSEEIRPRTPEELAEIENEVRIAAKANMRQGERREDNRRGIQSIAEMVSFSKKERRKDCWVGDNGRRNAAAGERRRVLSTFERDMLLEALNEDA